VSLQHWCIQYFNWLFRNEF